MEATVSIKRPSMNGFSIFVFRKPTDGHMASVEQQLPTDVAEYLKMLVEKDQANPTTPLRTWSNMLEQIKNLRPIKDAILSMLEESDHLDYAVSHTTDKTGGTIRVSRNTDPGLVRFRINFSAVGSMSNWQVKIGLTGNNLLPKLVMTHPPKDDVLSATFLENVTDIIERADANEYFS